MKSYNFQANLWDVRSQAPMSIPGNIQGRVGQGSEQPGLVEDVPAHGSGVGLDGLQRSLQTQTI